MPMVGGRPWMGKPARRGARHPGILSLSLPLWQAEITTWRKAGGSSKQAYRVTRTPVRIRGLAVLADACLVDG